jgi:hypothetical protein
MVLEVGLVRMRDMMLEIEDRAKPFVWRGEDFKRSDGDNSWTCS